MLESWLKGQKGNFRANSSLSFRAYSFLEDETFSQSGPLKEHERITKKRGHLPVPNVTSHLQIVVL